MKSLRLTLTNLIFPKEFGQFDSNMTEMLGSRPTIFQGGVVIFVLFLFGCAEIQPYGPESEDTALDSEGEDSAAETETEPEDTAGIDSDTNTDTDTDADTVTQGSDPCGNPELACEDRPEPRCVNGDLVTSEITSCEYDGEKANCSFKEVTSICENGCEQGYCIVSETCFFDENIDGINDVVEQPGSDPVVCWRRCPLPAVWNGNSCDGEAEKYFWRKGKEGCENLGYELPGAGYYTGPEVGGGILSGCRVVDLDWACDPCSESSVCSVMFPGDTGSYWTSTYRFYWLKDCYYKSNMSTGKLNFVDTSYRNLVRCILKK